MAGYETKLDDPKLILIGWWRASDEKFLPLSYSAAAERLGMQAVYILGVPRNDGGEVISKGRLTLDPEHGLSAQFDGSPDGVE